MKLERLEHMTANDTELTIEQSVLERVTCAQNFGNAGLIFVHGNDVMQ